ncbi:MAG: hypothetical protein HRU20_20735 [Pseudomonadales bacterium]|nr:hypothetical protein [Pseudomonadales bacterium]
MLKQIVLFFIVIFSVSAHSDVGAPWRIEMVALNNGETRHIKYNEITGETWWSKNLVWSMIKEPEPVSHSAYEFKVVSTGLNWRAIRIDKLSGQAWKNSRGTWVKISPAKQ